MWKYIYIFSWYVDTAVIVRPGFNQHIVRNYFLLFRRIFRWRVFLTENLRSDYSTSHMHKTQNVVPPAYNKVSRTEVGTFRRASHHQVVFARTSRSDTVVAWRHALSTRWGVFSSRISQMRAGCPRLSLRFRRAPQRESVPSRPWRRGPTAFGGKVAGIPLIPRHRVLVGVLASRDSGSEVRSAEDMDRPLDCLSCLRDPANTSFQLLRVAHWQASCFQM